MSLRKEAAYLYLLSKELNKVNKELKHLSKKAEHHIEKHNRSKSEEDRQRHRKKHHNVKTEMEKLLKRHNDLISTIRAHSHRFIRKLQDEHLLR
ncbi:hypothetical protein COV20_04485 [Candidatus Woesearchaeota archaeon CG10_big_fil_rev_8_21_14_0_10_45_16]|nr:MAG: hypothetical protein COV20_04485 [Candidatus Woesearchaeota archaeon CG10_big_fil_rev_8_21_14_0_10_45_16]